MKTIELQRLSVAFLKYFCHKTNTYEFYVEEFTPSVLASSATIRCDDNTYIIFRLADKKDVIPYIIKYHAPSTALGQARLCGMKISRPYPLKKQDVLKYIEDMGIMDIACKWEVWLKNFKCGYCVVEIVQGEVKYD